MSETLSKKAPVAEGAGAAQATGAAPEMKKVKLETDHTHEGVPHKAGDEIEVNEADEKWLRQAKIIK